MVLYKEEFNSIVLSFFFLFMLKVHFITFIITV